MAKFHLLHCVPADRRLHGLNGYKEVIETVHWGLEQLGHQVSYAANVFASNATNIIFGAQVMELEAFDALPSDTIVYNFEQLRGIPADRIRRQLKICAERFKIWDYSAANLDAWMSVKRGNVQVVPIGYAPILTRIPKPQYQDIDVLLYGSPGENRLYVFDALCRTGLSAAFLCGFYGNARDDLIARSKIVLNILSYDRAKIFEIVRVSYLWANRKAVISDSEPGVYMEEDVHAAITLSSLDDIAASCGKLLGDDVGRAEIEESGFAAISKRDIRSILEGSL